MRGLLAQALSGVATIAGIVAVLVGALIGVLTYRLTSKGQRGSDLERLQGTLSTWASETIDDLRADLKEEEARRHRELDDLRAELLADCARRCDGLRESLRWEFEAKLAVAEYRVDYWKGRALNVPADDDTPPPDTRPLPPEGT